MSPTEKIEPQDWMTAPETRAVVKALSAGGAEPRFVGGCVRDAVLGRPVKDVDIATPEPPERVVALLEQAGLKAVPTGIAHGTVTAVSSGRPFEVTSLRIDVETYGRHAKVAFTDDWQDDAARRDLTINALSCAPDGRIFDYFHGLKDLMAGRVRFVGDPQERIREDYLRLLRFFRFHAHYGRGAPDAKGLAAAGELAPEATKLSGERVREELLRLLGAPDPVPILEIMASQNILPVFLPEFVGADALAALLSVDPSHDIDDVLLRLAAILPSDPAVAVSLADRLRLSNTQRERLSGLLDPGNIQLEMSDEALKMELYGQGAISVRDRLLLVWARLSRDARGRTRGDLDRALAVTAAWQPKIFPLKGRDAVAYGVPKGPRVGRLLAEVESWWIERDFSPDRAACLARLKELAGS